MCIGRGKVAGERRSRDLVKEWRRSSTMKTFVFVEKNSPARGCGQEMPGKQGIKEEEKIPHVLNIDCFLFGWCIRCSTLLSNYGIELLIRLLSISSYLESNDHVQVVMLKFGFSPQSKFFLMWPNWAHFEFPTDPTPPWTGARPFIKSVGVSDPCSDVVGAFPVVAAVSGFVVVVMVMVNGWCCRLGSL